MLPIVKTNLKSLFNSSIHETDKSFLSRKTIIFNVCILEKENMSSLQSKSYFNLKQTQNNNNNKTPALVVDIVHSFSTKIIHGM